MTVSCVVSDDKLGIMMTPGAMPLLLTWINFNSTWIINHMPSKMLDEIIYPFPNFNGTTVEVWKWISNIMPHSIMDGNT